MIIKQNKSKKISDTNKYFRFSSFKVIKLLSINVKKVIKPKIKVIKKMNMTKKFFLINVIILIIYNKRTFVLI